MPNIDDVWSRIEAHEGEEFTMARGGVLTYKFHGTHIIPSRTSYDLSKSQFEIALGRVPIKVPGEIQDVRGPSYIWAILHDKRIRQNDW